jgi:hypothetical protein
LARKAVAIRFAVQIAEGRRANPLVNRARPRNIFGFIEEGLAAVLQGILDLVRGALGEPAG